MSTMPQRATSTASLLSRLIATPDLVRAVQALPGPTFSALVRRIGVEDAGELLALASNEQLVDAFDEDLFRNDRPGERETFDAARFALWLDVLLEAGEAQAAQRFSTLSLDFVVQALSSQILVVDHEALLDRMARGDAAARRADKAIESTLSEEIDGYLLLSRQPDGWDAVLSLILALDRDHRSFLERVLDRCAQLASGCLDDLDELSTALSAEESLAEEVEAEREARRSQHGYVDPRAAKAFLRLSQTPPTDDQACSQRDPITAAYFRERSAAPAATTSRSRHAATRATPNPPAEPPPAALAALLTLNATDAAPPPALPAAAADSAAPPIVAALQQLAEHAPAVFSQRMEELTYLANVLVAGATPPGRPRQRLRPAEAAQAALLTVGLGAELMTPEEPPLTAAALLSVLRSTPADRLFRQASQWLTTHLPPRVTGGFLSTPQDLDAAHERRRHPAAPPKARGR